MRSIKKSSAAILLLTIFIALGPYYLLFHRPDEVSYTKSRKKPEWTGVITMWDYPRVDQSTGSSTSWIYDKIKKFEKENPGVFIKFDALSWERGATKLDSALKSGSLPDIVPLGGNYSFFGKGVLEPLNEYLSREELESFKENALRAVEYEGKIMAIPWMMNTYTMLLNLDLFRKRGVEPPVGGNWTYEEFLEKLQELTFDSKGRGRVDHFGFNSFIQPGYYNIWGIILNDGARLMDSENTYSFNDEKAVAGIKKIIDLKHRYKVTHPRFGENNPNEAWAAFYKDKNVAVFPTGTWAIQNLERLKIEGKGFEYAVANFPTGRLGRPVILSNSVASYGITKQEDKQKQEMIVEFLKFLVQDEFQVELKRLGVFPVKKGIGNLYEDNEHMTFVYNSLQYTEVIPPHPDWRGIDELLQRELQQGLAGNKAPESIIKDAAVKVESYIRTKD